MKSWTSASPVATARPAWLGVTGAVLIALPWLFPFTSGPSPAVWPWLASAVCGCLLACTVPWSLSRPLLVFCAAAAFLTAWAWISHPNSGTDTIYLAAGLSLIVLLAAIAQDGRLNEGLKTGLLLAALVSALLGLIQYFGLSPNFSPWVDIAPAGEAFANLRQTNQFATLCWIGMAVLLFSLPRFGDLLASACAVLLAVASAASVSRTGLLQGAALLVLVGLWPAEDRRRRVMVCVVAATSYVAASVFLPIIFDLLNGAYPPRTLMHRMSGDAGCSSRIVLWSNVVQLIKARPLLGWGWGGLDEAHFLTLYPGARFCEILDNAHNLPLHLAVELGLPVAALVTGWGVLWAWRRYPRRDADPLRQLAWGLLTLLTIHSLLEYPLWYGPFQMVFGAAMGWLLPSPVATGGARKHLSMAGRLVASGLLVMTTFAAWDYWRASQIYLPPDQRRGVWRNDPLQEAQRSWLFAPQARFAELTLTPISRANADEMARLARDMLRYSPEPRTVERLIEADTLVGRDDEAIALLARFRAAYPDEYARWREANRPNVRPTLPAVQD